MAFLLILKCTLKSVCIKSSYNKHTQNLRKNLRKLKDITSIEFLKFFWTKYILLCQNWPNIIQDIGQNAKIAFNFLPDNNHLCILNRRLCKRPGAVWFLCCSYYEPLRSKIARSFSNFTIRDHIKVCFKRFVTWIIKLHNFFNICIIQSVVERFWVGQLQYKQKAQKILKFQWSQGRQKN